MPSAVVPAARTCPLCGGIGRRAYGVRGNREHRGADPRATPHLRTQVVGCLGCGFVFTDPVIPEAAALEEAHYNSSEGYTAAEHPAAMFGARLELLAGYRTPPGKLLDVGAGKGEFVEEALSRGWDARGIEPSAGFTAHARGRGLPIVHGLLEARPAGDDAVDVITLHHVLEHVERPRKLLGHVSDWLRPNGLAYIEVPNVTSNMCRLVDTYFRFRGRRWSSRLSPVHPPFHQYGYGPKALRYVLEACGFAVIGMGTISGRERPAPSNGRKGFEARALGLAFSLMDTLPNRELLWAVATPGPSSARKPDST